MALFGGTIEEWKEATLVIVDTLSERLGTQGGSLLAEEGGIVDAILGRIFTTIDGAMITIDHAELKHPMTVTFRLPKPIPQEK